MSKGATDMQSRVPGALSVPLLYVKPTVRPLARPAPPFLEVSWLGARVGGGHGHNGAQDMAV